MGYDEIEAGVAYQLINFLKSAAFDFGEEKPNPDRTY